MTTKPIVRFVSFYSDGDTDLCPSQEIAEALASEKRLATFRLSFDPATKELTHTRVWPEEE